MAEIPSNLDPVTAALLEVSMRQSEALFAVAGILCGIIVREDLATREELAAAFEARDDIPSLVTFGKAIRMNFPGGRFDVIDGGRD